MASGRLAKSCLWAMFINSVMDFPVSQQRPRSLPPRISRYGYLWAGQRHLFLLPRPAATRPAATRHTSTRPAATRSAAIRPAAKRSCLSHSRPTSLILHDTLHWPRTSSFQLPWERRGVSDVMLSSFGFISLGTSPFASHRSSGLLCVSSLHSCGDTHALRRHSPRRHVLLAQILVSRIRGSPAGLWTSVFLSNQLLIFINTTSGHGIHATASRSSDSAIQRSKTDTPLFPQAHRRSCSDEGPAQRGLANTRVATPGSEHGRCVKQGRRPENRARNRTRKALLLLALSFGPPVRSSVSCVGGSVFLCGFFVPACPSARVAVFPWCLFSLGADPKNRAFVKATLCYFRIFGWLVR